MKYLKVSALGLGLGAALIMYSCGGGGGGTTTSASTPTVTPATSSDIQNATSLSAGSAGLETVSNLLTGVGNNNNNAGGVPTPLSLNQSIKSLIYSKLKELSKSGKILAQGTSEGTYNCQDGGTVTFKYSWTNPNCTDPSNDYDAACWKNNEITSTFVANNCKEYGWTYNGSGSSVDKYDNNGWYYGKTHIDKDWIEESDYYKYTYSTGFDWEYNRINNNTYKISLNGNYEYDDKYQNKSYKSTFKTVSFQAEYLKEDEYGDVIEGNYTVNGGIVSYVNGQLEADVAAQNLTIYSKVGNSVAGIPDVSRINGYLYDGSCTKKWYKFETLQDIKTPVGNTCPTEGQLKINNSLTLTATSNGGIITSDGKTFNSCKDLESQTCNVK
ncbi:hypothetical protein JCM14244_01550 [Venenivibrio stagnispumantis]|uniref:Lipoprotein n=1 Tax=Venenivibrio stagnispumantis TaxID=407998 RepID=A0AA45WKH2_9AQUI|nr:hypothetical protein [Venenivibrio stagnispumantis]MCW4573458.1 hypothetical protein [Venenivibrio stagnispumantis]SMP06836.1 hypothetical protein SAMN06264868_10497 [Venenivibrio stagnispumantis]